MWYHITDNYHGKQVTFTPRIPSTGSMKECKNINRICFAPSLKQALMAVQGHTDWHAAYLIMTNDYSSKLKRKPKLIHIYGIHGNSKVKHPTVKRVADVKITGEVWRLVPTTLKHFGVIKIVKNEPVIGKWAECKTQICSIYRAYQDARFEV